jgi:uncharacterized OB-fold protein
MSYLQPYTLEYGYKRSVGPTLGRFFEALLERRILGARTRAGKVVVPPAEFDPETGEPILPAELVEVGPRGVVTTWSWVEHPRPGQPLDRAFAWALIRLDGADTALLHAIDAGSFERMRTGMRVRARFRSEPKGEILDLACFEPEPEPEVAQ